MIYDILPIIFFIITTSFFVFAFNIKFGLSLPINFMCTIIFCYIFALFHISLYVPFVILLVFFIFSIFILIRNFKNSNFKSNYISFGLISFILLSVFIIYINKNRHYICWDDFSHWARMVRYMVNTNQLYTGEEMTLLHKNYPPCMQLFEYIWVRLSLRYTESATITAINIFELSIFILPLIEILTKDIKKITIAIIVSLFVIVSTLMLFAYFDNFIIFNSLCVDLALSSYFAFLFMLIFRVDVDRKYFIILSIACFAFALLKTVSVVYIGILILFCIVRIILSFIVKKNEQNNINIKTELIKPATIFVSFMASFVIWKIYIIINKVPEDFSVNKMSLSKLIAISKGSGAEMQVHAFKTFINAIFKKQIAFGLFKPTFIQFMIAFSIIILLVLIINRKNILTVINSISLLIGINIGAIAYIFVHLCTFMFLFTDEELNRLASFNRYMDSFLLGVALIIISYNLYIYVHYNNKKSILAIIFIPLIFTLFGMNFQVLSLQKDSTDHMKSIRVGCGVSRSLIESEKKVYMIYDLTNDFVNVAMPYYSYDYSIPLENKSLNKSAMTNTESGKWPPIIDEISKCDYVWVANVNKIIVMKLVNYFDKNKIYECSLYAVKKVGDTFTLVKSEYDYEEKE